VKEKGDYAQENWNRPDKLGYEFWLGWKVKSANRDDVLMTSTYMVGQVGIHDDHKVSRAEIEAMYVCGSTRRRAIVKVSRDNRARTPKVEGVPEAKLASAWFKNDLVLAVGGSQLPRNLLSTIRAVVVDDDHLPGEVTIHLHHTSAVPAHGGAPRSNKAEEADARTLH